MKSEDSHIYTVANVVILFLYFTVASFLNWSMSIIVAGIFAIYIYLNPVKSSYLAKISLSFLALVPLFSMLSLSDKAGLFAKLFIATMLAAVFSAANELYHERIEKHK